MKMTSTFPEHKLSRTQLRLLTLIIFLVSFPLIVCMGATPPPAIQLTVIGHPHTLIPGEQVRLQAQVSHRQGKQAIQGAKITVKLSDRSGYLPDLFTGETDEKGQVAIAFQVPNDISPPNSWLRLDVHAASPEGSTAYSQSVRIGEPYKILLSTDKPIYQPGQTIRIRALALGSLNLHPANHEEINIQVSDAKQNVLVNETLTTSEWGVATTDLILDSQAGQGHYEIWASIGASGIRQAVQIKPYRLPKFEVTVQTDRSYYAPGETAFLSLDAAYFHRKPVSNGQVAIKGYIVGQEKRLIFEETGGQTDENGHYQVHIPLPSYSNFRQYGYSQNEARFHLDVEISVIDETGQLEMISDRLVVSNEDIHIWAVGESGGLVADVENIVYVHATYPDGSPATGSFTVSGRNVAPVNGETDQNGFSQFRLTPSSDEAGTYAIMLMDADGRRGSFEATWDFQHERPDLLVRTDKVRYQVGDMLNLEVFVSGYADTVFLEIVKGGRSIDLQAIPVEGNVVTASFPIEGSLLGDLGVYAYIINGEGQAISDKRFVLIDSPAPTIDIIADADVYRPGDNAQLNLAVSQEGRPVEGVLGISIVDESVLTLGDQSTGFARTYFLLNRHLQTPQYQLHDFQHNRPIRRYDGYHHTGIRTAELAPDTSDTSLLAQREATESWVHARDTALAGAIAQELARVDEMSMITTTTEDGVPWQYLLLTPVLGLIYTARQSRLQRIMLGGMIIVALSTLAIGCSPSVPAPQPPEVPVADNIEDTLDFAADDGTELLLAPRLRQFFPETLYWQPELETDANGQAQLTIPLADTITTWHVSVLASDDTGTLGSAEFSLPVFQDFFIEPALPTYLNKGDTLSVPIRIFNYLDVAQKVQLAVTPASWFEFTAEPPADIFIEANDTTVVYIPIKAVEAGLGEFQINAIGAEMSDAVLKQVEVVFDGRPITAVENGQLTNATTHQFTLPEDALPETSQVSLKLIPNVTGQLLEGLDGLLQEPRGCFEQTGSTTYPNVLILDYLNTTGQINPEIQTQAKHFIHLGYQRLLNFEVENAPGGFSYWGSPPPMTILTAYGLLQFTDMSNVSYVDPALLERTANYLFQQQQPDGSWRVDNSLQHAFQDDNLTPTAYITWALAQAGYGSSQPVRQSLGYLNKQVSNTTDPYTMALVANALLAVDSTDDVAAQLLQTLSKQVTLNEDSLVHWGDLSKPTLTGSYGISRDAEISALVTL
ncbi:MAG: MG2 domain-containing protein, partial [Chloroflexota bacterium]